MIWYQSTQYSRRDHLDYLVLVDRCKNSQNGTSDGRDGKGGELVAVVRLCGSLENCGRV